MGTRLGGSPAGAEHPAGYLRTKPIFTTQCAISSTNHNKNSFAFFNFFTMSREAKRARWLNQLNEEPKVPLKINSILAP